MTNTPTRTTPDEIPEPPRKSPWSRRAQIVRALWGVLGVPLFRFSPTPLHGWRRFLLRRFGASIGKNVRIHPAAKVIIPWNLTIHDNAVVHDRAILYALGPISIGQDSEIGSLSHICAGTHDYTDPKFTLLREPITIGPRCILGTATFIAPRVVLAPGTITHPRAAIYANTEPDTQYIGNPAKPVPCETERA